MQFGIPVQSVSRAAIIFRSNLSAGAAHLALRNLGGFRRDITDEEPWFYREETSPGPIEPVRKSYIFTIAPFHIGVVCSGV